VECLLCALEVTENLGQVVRIYRTLVKIDREYTPHLVLGLFNPS